MDGTFGGGDLISASLAIMLGGTDAELHDKEVTLTTSDVTGSQTAVFEYDPQNEPVSGDPPGPWDGYSLFTIDLSGVKDDIEDLQQQIADAEACRQQVIAVLQQYDPDYDPAEGECPASKVDDLYDDYYEDEQTIADLQEQIEECNQCKADVIAKLQEYDPDFDPQTCEDIPPEIDKIVDENKGVVVPDGVDPAPIALELNGTVTDDDIHASVQIVFLVSTNPDVYVPVSKIECPPYNNIYPFLKIKYMQSDTEMVEYLTLMGSQGIYTAGEYGEILGYTIGTDGQVTVSAHYHLYQMQMGTMQWIDTYPTGQTGSQHLVGWGDTGHTQRITN